MPYPTSFGTLVDQQSLGAQTINVYPTLAALGLEQGLVQNGQLAAVQSPIFTLYQANTAIPGNGQYSVASTSSSQLSGGGGTTYWIQIASGDIYNANFQQMPFTARAVVTSLPAYTGTGTGTLTGPANTALGTQDGVSTLAVGDQIFLQGGTTNLTAVDSGPWVILALGSGTSQYVLKRPAWFFTGNKFTSGLIVNIGGEGTVFGNTEWKSTSASGTIDTNDAKFYVGRINLQRALSAGVGAMAAGQATGTNMPVGILSASISTVTATVVSLAGTYTTTVSYGTRTALTPGYLGTSTATVYANAAGFTTDATDTSTLNICIVNW